MANFKIALDKVLSLEGGYVNDPDDKGGETYKGISRRYNSKWKGWSIIDNNKYKCPNLTNKERTKSLEFNKELNLYVQEIYKNNYWDCFELDNIPNQQIAEMMFDTCVNQGQVAAIKFAEKTLNLRVSGKWSLNLLNKLMAIK